MNTYQTSIKNFEWIIQNKKTASHLKFDAAQKMAAAHIHHHNYELALNAIRKCESYGEDLPKLCHRKMICYARLGMYRQGHEYARGIELIPDIMYNRQMLAAKVEFFKIRATVAKLQAFLQHGNYNMASKMCYALQLLHYKGLDLPFYKFECILELQGAQQALTYAV